MSRNQKGSRATACSTCHHVGMKQQAGSIRQKAARRKPTLNRVVLDELTVVAIGGNCGDFSDVVGRWTPDAAFDEILAAQRQIDWGRWKCGMRATPTG